MSLFNLLATSKKTSKMICANNVSFFPMFLIAGYFISRKPISSAIDALAHAIAAAIRHSVLPLSTLINISAGSANQTTSNKSKLKTQVFHRIIVINISINAA